MLGFLDNCLWKAYHNGGVEFWVGRSKGSCRRQTQSVPCNVVTIVYGSYSSSRPQIPICKNWSGANLCGFGYVVGPYTKTIWSCSDYYLCDNLLSATRTIGNLDEGLLSRSNGSVCIG